MTGSYSFDGVLVRLDPAGALDTTFASGGMVVSTSAWNDEIAAVAVQGDGKIVVAGYADVAAAFDRGMQVARLTTTGHLDTTFNGTGYLKSKVSGTAAGASGLDLDGSDRAVVAGATTENPTLGFVSRHTSTGTPDSTFGSEGWRIVDPAPTDDDEAIDVVVQADGKIVVAGVSGPAIMIARFTADGQPDTTFSDDGVAVYPVPACIAYGASLAIQSDGKYVVGGSCDDGQRYSSVIIRALP